MFSSLSADKTELFFTALTKKEEKKTIQKSTTIFANKLLLFKKKTPSKPSFFACAQLFFIFYREYFQKYHWKQCRNSESYDQKEEYTGKNNNKIMISMYLFRIESIEER